MTATLTLTGPPMSSHALVTTIVSSMMMVRRCGSPPRREDLGARNQMDVRRFPGNRCV